MPTVITRTYYLEINGIPLATPAWECPDLSPLLDDPQLRGADGILPYVNGGVPYRRRINPTVYTLALDVFGDQDHEGDPYDDAFEGLLTNFDYLKANLGLASETGDGTVGAIFHRGDLDQLTAEVHFLGFKGSRTSGSGTPSLLRTTFDISVPVGRFTETGS